MVKHTQTIRRQFVDELFEFSQNNFSVELFSKSIY